MDSCGGKGKELGLEGHSSSTSAEKNNTERVLGTDDAINEGSHPSTPSPNINHPRKELSNLYSSNHHILLVGEGDFSFSTSLASSFGVATKIVATSLDCLDVLLEKYVKAKSNLLELSMRGSLVLHEIDAIDMSNHNIIGRMKFDRIIYNFPYANNVFKEFCPRKTQIRRHRMLVSGFLKNAKEMVSENGEIHIRHKTDGFYKDWKIEKLASLHGLTLVEAVEFNKADFLGYNTKRGFFGDQNFECNPSNLFKFRL